MSLDKNKILSGIFYILGLLPIAGSQFLPQDTNFLAENPNLIYVGSGFSFVLGLFFTWRAKRQYAKAMEAANKQMAEAQAQFQQMSQNQGTKK